MKVFTPAQMREFDRTATIEYSIPSIVLMENAALRVVEFLEWKFAPLQEKRVVVLCGKGNNGGDGFAIARHLAACGCHLNGAFDEDESLYSGDALTNFKALQAIQKAETVTSFQRDLTAFSGAEFGSKVDIVVDCLLGTGFDGELREPLKTLLHNAPNGFCTRVAVDVPSGLNAQRGEAADAALRADFTITFAAPKTGMLLRDGIKNCGEIWVGDIGTAPVQMTNTQTECEAITREMAHSLLPQRPLDAHKGTAGKVVICGGSRGMSGAVALAATASLRVGVGLCAACVPDRVLDVFASHVVEATSHALLCDDEGRLVPAAADALPEICKNADVVALGPGLSRSDDALDFARRVARECALPLVIDADALYSLRAIADEVKARNAPTILTPHPGEIAELLQSDAKTVNQNRLESALECARRFNAIVLLKGARSVVATPDGQTFFNLTGNAGMATGGSGDVLTGTIAGLLAQLKNPLNATLLGVYLHGLAGDIEYSKRGNGLVAHDIAASLPHAILDLKNQSQSQQINARLRRLE